ncbi:MAG: thioredoxin-disulfide reductase [Alphaproteobacteria bacterium]|nr:thioredoxin-disulfide reductase [Alphaproteobacteria bacterium]
MIDCDVLIIGSGPAGYTAALYTTRAGLKTNLYTGVNIGGQLMYTHAVENFPAFDFISGPDLMEKFQHQVKSLGTNIFNEKITHLKCDTYPFEFKTETNQIGQAKTVILATGANAKWLGATNEEKYKGNGISVCATCDGFFYRNKTIAVIGGGSTALYEALYLSHIAEKVYLINRSDIFVGEPILQKQVFNHPKIHVLYHTIVQSFEGDSRLKSINIVDTKTQKRTVLPVNGVFEAIGTEPETSLVHQQILLTPSGHILTDKRTMATSVNGIFACGDVQEDTYRQAIIAAGSGCIAALSAEKFIFSNR